MRQSAPAAAITGNAQLETEAGHEQNIVHWAITHDFVEWTVNVTQSGNFDVELNYACDPKSGGQITVSAGSAKLNITIPPTKSWADFTVAKVGQLKLDKSGPVTITIKPVKKQGEGLLNLRNVVLKPRAERSLPSLKKSALPPLPLRK